MSSNNPGQPKALCKTTTDYKVKAKLNWNGPSFSLQHAKDIKACGVPDCPQKIKAGNSKEQATDQSKKS